MTLTLEEIQSKIPGSRIQNRNLMAPCPLHNDTENSLQITIEDDEHRPAGGYCHACGKDGQRGIEKYLRELGFNKPKFKNPKRTKVNETEYGTLISPIPKDLLFTYRTEITHKQSDPNKVYVYKYPWQDETYGYRIRTDTVKSEPWTLWEKGGEKKRINKAWAKDRLKHKLPLYVKGPASISACNNVDTLVVHEGEKATDAGARLFDDEYYMHVSWQEGAKGVSNADWNALKEFQFNEIIFIPDNDEPGHKVMSHLSKHLLYKLKPTKISIVDTTQFEDRFDCADVNQQNIELFKKAFEQRKDITRDTIRSEPQWVYIQNTGAWIDLHEPINAEDGIVLFGKEKFNNIMYSRYGTSPEPHKQWLSNMGNPQFQKLTFRPGNRNQIITTKEGKKQINLWQDGGQVATPGDATPFLNLLEYLVPDAKLREFLLITMAHIVQNPGVRCNYATVFVSDQKGGGKTTIATIMEYCVGRLYSLVVKSKLVSAKFNALLANKVFVAVEEVRVGGNYDAKIDLMNEYKMLITGEDIYIEKKGIDAFRMPNNINFFAMSNFRDCFTLDPDERRWFVLFFEGVKKEQQYFRDLYNWLENGGYEICYYFLKMFEIPNWYDPREAPPKTEWFYEVCDMSKNEMATQLDELYHRGISLFKPDGIQIDGKGDAVPMELVCPKHFVEYLKLKYFELKDLKLQMFTRWLTDKGARKVAQDVRWINDNKITLWAWRDVDKYKAMKSTDLRKLYAEPRLGENKSFTHWQTLHAQKVWEEKKRKNAEKEGKTPNASEDFEYSTEAEEDENLPF